MIFSLVLWLNHRVGMVSFSSTGLDSRKPRGAEDRGGKFSNFPYSASQTERSPSEISLYLRWRRGRRGPAVEKLGFDGPPQPPSSYGWDELIQSMEDGELMLRLDDISSRSQGSNGETIKAWSGACSASGSLFRRARNGRRLYHAEFRANS